MHSGLAALRSGWAARRAFALGALLLGLGVLGVAAAVPASAHAELVSATPAAGQRMATAPASVTLTFSEPVSIETGYLRVLDAAGKRVDQGTPQHPGNDGATVSVGVRDGLPEGGYLVSYRVVSADSHPVGGAYSFAVGNGAILSATGPVGGGAVNGPVGTVFTVTRWLGFAGLALLGGAVFLTVCWREGRLVRRARALVWTGWGLVAGTAALGLLLEGPYGAGSGLSRMFSPSLLGATLQTGYGRMLSARLVLLAALAVVLAHLLDSVESPPWLEDTAALAGLGTLATFGGAGHAVAGTQAPLAVFADTVHLAAMATWLGGLLVIVFCLLYRADALSAALPVFSPMAMGCVGALVVTGTYRSWRDIGSWGALLGTTYGRIVIVKVALLALLVVLGNASRLWVRRLVADPLPVGPGGAAGGAGPADGSGGDPGERSAGEPARGWLAALDPGAPLRRELASVRAGGSAAAPPAGTGPAGDESPDAAGGEPPDPADPHSGGNPPEEPPDAGSAASRIGVLRKSVLAELGIAAVVLAFTAVLVAEPPGRATYIRPADTTVTLASGDRVQVTVTPAKAGANTVDLYVTDRGGRTRDVLSAEASARLPGTVYDRLPVTLSRTGPGHYTASATSLPAPGRWELNLSVRLSQFDAYTATAQVTIR